jgi:hypothetical protein
MTTGPMRSILRVGLRVQETPNVWRPNETSCYLGGVGIALLATGCTITLPEPIRTPQVNGHYDRVQDSVLKEEAVVCAGRLNRHRDDAGLFNGVRVAVTATGGLAAGVGGVIAAASKDEAQKNAAIVAAIGGGVALIGTFLTTIIGDPSDKLTRHSRAIRSWDEATNEADAAFGHPQERAQHVVNSMAALKRCQADEPPLTAAQPSGPAVPSL